MTGERLLSAYRTLNGQDLGNHRGGGRPGQACRKHAFAPIRVLTVLSTVKRSPSMKYQVKIRFQGHISWVEADANNASQAKELVRQQYGPEVTVLNCKMAEKD